MPKAGYEQKSRTWESEDHEYRSMLPLPDIRKDVQDVLSRLETGGRLTARERGMELTARETAALLLVKKREPRTEVAISKMRKYLGSLIRSGRLPEDAIVQYKVGGRNYHYWLGKVWESVTFDRTGRKTPVPKAQVATLQSQITGAMERVLSERERTILTKRYDLDDTGHASTLEELGEQFHVSGERIRQIEAAALKKLQAAQ